MIDTEAVKNIEACFDRLPFWPSCVELAFQRAEIGEVDFQPLKTGKFNRGELAEEIAELHPGLSVEAAETLSWASWRYVYGIKNLLSTISVEDIAHGQA